MIDIELVYRSAARRWRPEALGRCYHDALERGEQDPPAGEPTSLGLLAQAVPRLITLGVSTYAMDVLPTGGSDGGGEGVLTDLLTAVETSAAGGLLRCHRALELDEERRGETADAWFPTIYETAAERLAAITPSDEPPLFSDAAQQAGRWVAVAIESLDGDGSQAAEAIVDALGHLLVVCAMVSLARGRPEATADPVALQRPSQRPL